VDETERAAFLAGAVVRQHEDQRVVGNPGCLQESDQPRQMAVGVIEHACKRVNTRFSSAECSSQAFTPSLRAGILVSGGTRPIAFCRASRCSRSTSQPWAKLASYGFMISAGAWCGAWQAPSATQVSHGRSGRSAE